MIVESQGPGAVSKAIHDALGVPVTTATEELGFYSRLRF